MTALLGLVILALAASAQQTPKAAVSFEEKSLASIPEDLQVDPKAIVFGSDGKSVSYIGHRQGRSFLTYGNRKGEELPQAPVLLCADGETIAYIDNGTVVVGDKKGPKFAGVERLFLSPDGKTVAYHGLIDNKLCMVFGDSRGESFGQIHPPVFSPDGKTLAYVAYEADAAGKRSAFVVVGTKKGEPFDGVQEPTFSPDGKTAAYAAFKRDLQQPRTGKWFAVVGGEKKEEYDELFGPINFSPDGKSVSYAARKGDKGIIVVGAQKRLEFDLQAQVYPHPIFSPDGKGIAYAVSGRDPASDQPKYFVFAGEKKSVGLDLLVGPMFTPDGKVAYAGALDGGRRQLVVVGDKKYEGSRLIPESILNETFKALFFSREGKAFAYVVQEGEKQFVVAGQKRGEAFDRVVTNPVFSSDGRKVAFGALQGRQLWWKVVELNAKAMSEPAISEPKPAEPAKKPPGPSAPPAALEEMIQVELGSFGMPAGSGGEVLLRKGSDLFLVSWPEGGAAPGSAVKVCSTEGIGRCRLAFVGSKPSVLTMGQGVTCWTWLKEGYQRAGRHAGDVVAVSRSGRRVVVTDEAGQSLLDVPTLAVLKKHSHWWGLEKLDRSEGPSTFFISDDGRTAMRVDEKSSKDPAVTIADLEAGTTRSVVVPIPKNWEDWGNHHVKDCLMVSGKVVLIVAYYGMASKSNWHYAVIDEAGGTVVEAPFPNWGPGQMPWWTRCWDPESGFVFFGAKGTPSGTGGHPANLENWLSLDRVGSDGKLLESQKRMFPRLPGELRQNFFTRW